MDVSEVKVKLVEENKDRLKAYCTMTLDGEFVVRDLKLIEGANGLFVAMPSRKLSDRCPSCGGKNHLRARYCNNCGGRLDEGRAGMDREGRPKLHADIAHPINSGCRERIQKSIEQAYYHEVERSKQPGYRPTKLDEDDFDAFDAHHAASKAEGGRHAPESEGQPPAAESGGEPPAESDEPKHKFGEGIL